MLKRGRQQGSLLALGFSSPRPLGHFYPLLGHVEQQGFAAFAVRRLRQPQASERLFLNAETEACRSPVVWTGARRVSQPLASDIGCR
jgi:hypothetical protein